MESESNKNVTTVWKIIKEHPQGQRSNQSPPPLPLDTLTLRSGVRGRAQQQKQSKSRRLNGRVSGPPVSLRYIFGAGSSRGCGDAGVSGPPRLGRLLRAGGLPLPQLEAAPAGLVEPQVPQHGLGEPRVREAGPLREQRLHHVAHEAWWGRDGE